jgi:hypothetical protein
MKRYKCPRCGFMFDSDAVVKMYCPCGDKPGSTPILMEVCELPAAVPGAGQHVTLAGDK